MSYSTGGSINCVPGKSNFKTKKSKTPALCIPSWNARMMRIGLCNGLQEIGDARKTAVIDRELRRLGIDIVALQKTWLPECGSLKEKHYTFFWQEKGVEESHQEHSAPHDGTLNGETELILTDRFFPSVGFVNFVCIYAPTLLPAPEVKDQFYDHLYVTINRIQASEHVYILEDFNVRVGAHR